MTTHPTALADQIDAASADAARRLRHAASATPGARYTDGPAPDWLAEQFQRLTLTLTLGGGRYCKHLGPAPRVVHAFAWAPGLMLCPACRWLATPAPTENHTCDRCHHHVDTVIPCLAAHGPVILGYGLCRACHTAAG